MKGQAPALSDNRGTRRALMPLHDSCKEIDLC